MIMRVSSLAGRLAFKLLSGPMHASELPHFQISHQRSFVGRSAAPHKHIDFQQGNSELHMCVVRIKDNLLENHRKSHAGCGAVSSMEPTITLNFLCSNRVSVLV